MAAPHVAVAPVAVMLDIVALGLRHEGGAAHEDVKEYPARVPEPSDVNLIVIPFPVDAVKDTSAVTSALS